VLKVDTSNRDNRPIHLKFNDDLLQGETHIKFLGIEIDKSLNWKTQVNLIVPKLGKACFVLRKMKLYSNIKILKMIYCWQ
jgi:hypothetical protein